MASISNIQRELLRLYARDVSDETLREVKQVLAAYFAGRATDKMEEYLERTDTSVERISDWADEHSRSEDRTRH
jgi:hypothetical protein